MSEKPPVLDLRAFAVVMLMLAAALVLMATLVRGR